MTFVRRHPLLLLFVLVFFLGFAILSSLAHSAPVVPPVPDPLERPVEFWGVLGDLRRSGGAYLVVAVFVAHVARSVARRLAPAGGAAVGWRARAVYTLTSVAMVAGALVDALAGSLGATGLVVAGAGAVALLSDPRDRANAPPTRPAAGTTVVMLVLLATALSSCAALQPRERAARGVQAGLDCTAPAMVAVAREGAALARAAILSAIRDDGTPDDRALREAGGALRDQGWRCAFAVALAVLATPPVQTADAPQALGLEVDGAALRAAGRALADDEWSVSGAILVPGGTL